jgi:hypothetical protein
VRDASWKAEEEDSSDETWGKMTSRSWGVSTRKESDNGMVKRRLAGGECSGDLPRGGGKIGEGKGSFGR